MEETDPLLRTVRERDPVTGERTQEVWIEVTRGPWVIAYRLLPREGQVAVAEVRVFPHEPRHRAGRWSDDPDSVPAEGLMKVIRSVKLQEALEAHPEILASLERQHGQDIVMSSFIERFDFTEAARDEPPNPGRRGRSDLHYARLAAEYVALVRKNDQAPIKTLSERNGRDMTWAIHEARSRELLTRPPPGRAGGELTEYAKKLLWEAGRKRWRKS